MTRIIPRELIKHLEWSPGQEVPQRSPVNPTPQPHHQMAVSIDDILQGRTFYSEKKKGSMYIGVAVALREALDFAGEDGYVATMPELIAAKLKADNNHDFWKKWYAVHTEEDIGIDTKGRFYSRGDPVLVVVNGGGILTPDRIMRAYNEGLISNSARYEQREFDDLLDGKLPNGDDLTLYRFEEIRDGVSNLPHRFGVVMPYSTAQNTKSDYHRKKDFMENPLVIARAGGLEHLDAYFEKAKRSENKVGSWHPFSGRDASVPQGRVLFLINDCGGLVGGILSGDGLFVGVAPEARSGARK